MIQATALPAFLALFFYGTSILVVLLFVYTLGVVRERRRLRDHYFTGDQLHTAEIESYHQGLKHGHERAVHEMHHSAASLDVDLGT